MGPEEEGFRLRGRRAAAVLNNNLMEPEIMSCWLQMIHRASWRDYLLYVSLCSRKTCS